MKFTFATSVLLIVTLTLGLNGCSNDSAQILADQNALDADEQNPVGESGGAGNRDRQIRTPENRLSDDKKSTEKNSVDNKKIVLKPNQTITTAEQYLYAFEHQPAQFNFYKYALSEIELEKVATALRKKYGFKSLRKRLDYEQSGNRKTGPNPSTISFRRIALMKLHSDEVKSFIARPMNGMSRMVGPSPEMLRIPRTDPQSPDRFTFQPGDSSLKQKAILRLHQTFANNFADSQSSTAYVKSIDEVAGFRPHTISLNLDAINSPKSIPLIATDPKERAAFSQQKLDDDTFWKMRKFQLVNLLKHREPRVYLSKNIPSMDELSAAGFQTRQLNEFEKPALSRLLDGEQIVVNDSPRRMQMLGAIRAQSQCLECHSVNEGKLLGAFSYEFDIVDRDNQRQQSNRESQTGT